MGPPVVAGLGASAAVGGVADLLAGGLSFLGGERANAKQIALAREQMAFQERMSSTAFQRATADMRMSGINPMLAFQQGGASSPGGAMATVSDTIGPAVSSALHAGRLKSEVALIRQQAANVRADTDMKAVAAEEIAQRTAKERVETELSRSELAKARNLEEMEKTRAGRIMNWTKRIAESLPSFLVTGPQFRTRGMKSQPMPTVQGPRPGASVTPPAMSRSRVRAASQARKRR